MPSTPIRKLTRRFGAGFAAVTDAFVDAYRRGGMILPAGLAFFGLMAIAPLLFVVAFIGANVLGDSWSDMALYQAVVDRAGPQAAQLIADWLHRAAEAPSGVPLTIAALLLSLWSASRLFSEARWAVRHLWGDKRPRDRSVLRFVKRRAKSLGLTLGLCILLALVVVTDVAVVDNLGLPGPLQAVADLVGAALGLAISVGILTLVYRLLLHRTLPWRPLAAGALLASIVMALARWGLDAYVSAGSASWSPLGLAGGVVALLLWAYLQALAFLLGAQLAFGLYERAGRAEDDADEPDEPDAEVRSEPDRPALSSWASGRLSLQLSEVATRDLLTRPFPMEIKLSEDGRRRLRVRPPQSIQVGPDGDLVVRCKVDLTWPLPVLPDNLVSGWLAARVTPAVEPVAGGGSALAFRMKLEELDVDWVPSAISDAVLDRIDARLNQHSVRWNFSDTLSTSIETSDRIEPLTSFEIAVPDATLEVREGCLEARAPIQFGWRRAGGPTVSG